MGTTKARGVTYPDELEALVADLTDTSWHNDTYDSLHFTLEDGHRYRLWVAEADPMEREEDDFPRYALMKGPAVPETATQNELDDIDSEMMGAELEEVYAGEDDSAALLSVIEEINGERSSFVIRGLPEVMNASMLREGDRVRMLDAVERYPHAYVHAGETGYVKHFYPDAGSNEVALEVCLDKVHEGLEDWDNCLVFGGDELWDAKEGMTFPLSGPDALFEVIDDGGPVTQRERFVIR